MNRRRRPRPARHHGGVLPALAARGAGCDTEAATAWFDREGSDIAAEERDSEDAAGLDREDTEGHAD